MSFAYEPQGGSRADKLDSLLLPGTLESVTRTYKTLAKRARETSFGPLEEDVVVLDTETTGLSFRDCELIEIAAARLSGKVVTDRFRTFVNPGRPIPKEIQRLTHISDLDVAGAPSPGDAVRGLAEFVGGSLVLAHNATFDRTFIEKVPGGRSVSESWIDTLSLSRVAMPRLRSHRLADMAQGFGCDSVTHRAMDDVDSLCGMWPIILCALTDLPDGLLSVLATMHPESAWSFRPIFAFLSQSHPSAEFDLRSVRASLVSGATEHPKEDAERLEGRLSCPSSDEIRAAFDNDGAISQMYQHYEVRHEQEKMALEVRDALDTSTHRAIEAGTGVGKTVAYLYPEVLFAKRNRITVGIATKTNALTDQLVSRELPALSKVIPGGIAYYSLKGYDHYPCLYRLDLAARSIERDEGASAALGDAASQDILTAIAVCYAFACQSPEGDLDALGIRWRNVPRRLLTISSADCLRARCPYYPNGCFVHGARRRAASGDVVVTNHSLLLSDIASDNAILPPIRHWVVDEAHGFEAEARRQWAHEVSADGAKYVFDTLGNSRRGLIHSLLVSTSHEEASALHTGLLSKASVSIIRASGRMADFFQALHGLLPLAGKSTDYDGVTLWIDSSVRSSSEWHELDVCGKECASKLEESTQFLDSAAKALQDAKVRGAGELLEPIRRLKEMRAALETVLDGEDESYVYSAQLFRQSRRSGQERLIAERLDVGKDLASEWLEDMMSVIFTSATIAVGSDFTYFDHAVGLDLLDVRTYKNVAFSSSYDLDKNMSVVLAKDLPQPNDRAYLDSLVELLYQVHVAMDGSVLTLFTNRRDMERVYEKLSPRLATLGLPLAYQERNTSVRRLGERFVSDQRLSLLALKSFWEGFDAVGDTLRCVVIPKMPFANPRDPLVKERDHREPRSWWRYSLPEAIISVKQASGRLVRSSTDTGIVVLADSRLAHKRYGKQVMGAMPSNNRVVLDSENVGKYIRMWRASKKH